MIRCKLVEYCDPNATQVLIRVGRAVSGDMLTIGRAASSHIYLPDPRVRRDHATIRRAGDGTLMIDARGPITVEQRTVTSIALAAGQKITIGPYEFIVESVDDGPGKPAAMAYQPQTYPDGSVNPDYKDLAIVSLQTAYDQMAQALDDALRHDAELHSGCVPWRWTK